MSNNKEIPFVETLPSHWNEIPNRFLFEETKDKVGDRFSEYQLLSLTTKGIKVKDINASGGKVPESYENYQIVKKGQMVFCLFDLDCSAVFSGFSHLDGMITSAYNVYNSKNLLTNEFANYWFQYVFSNRYYKMYSKNIRYSVTGEMFKSIKTPVPSIKEQMSIANFLDKKIDQIDSLISNQEQQIEKLKAYKQSLITEVVTKGLNPNAPMKDSDLRNGYIIPSHWKTIKFKNVAVLCNGKEIECDGGIVPVYGSGGVFKFTDKPLHSGQSLLMGRKGTIDKPMLVDGEFWTVDTMFYTSSFKNIVGKYLLYCCLGVVDYGYYKSGSVLPSMTQSEINNISIPYPSIIEQQEIVDYLDEKCAKIDSLIKIKQKKIEKLNEYKKSLIYEYVTGKKEAI